MQSIAQNPLPVQPAKPAGDSASAAQSASDDDAAGAARFAEVLRGKQAARSREQAQSDKANAKPQDPAAATAPADPAAMPADGSPALSPDVAAALAQLQHGLATQARCGADGSQSGGAPTDPGTGLRSALSQATAGDIRLASPMAAPSGTPNSAAVAGAPSKALHGGAEAQAAGVRASPAEGPGGFPAAAAAANGDLTQTRTDAAQARLATADKLTSAGAATEPAATRFETPAWASFAVPADMAATRQAAPVQHSPVIDAPVGSQRFADAAAQQVTWMARNGISEAEIRVKPAELGPISVRIEMNQNEAIINFAVTQPETRAAVQDAMHRLQEMLAESGISLGEANVGGQGFTQQSRDNGGGTRSRVTFPAGNSGSAAGALGAPARLAATLGRGVVDTFA